MPSVNEDINKQKQTFKLKKPQNKFQNSYRPTEDDY